MLSSFLLILLFITAPQMEPPIEVQTVGKWKLARKIPQKVLTDAM